MLCNPRAIRQKQIVPGNRYRLVEQEAMRSGIEYIAPRKQLR